MCRDCCCGPEGHDFQNGSRKVLTKAEKLENLKNYAENLKKELTAVDEHIQELSK